MRKIFYLMTVAILVSSCAQDTILDDVNTDSNIYVHKLSATIAGDSNSRVTIGDKLTNTDSKTYYNLKWSEGDKFKVFDETGNVAEYQLTGTAGERKGTFETATSLNVPKVAIFPSSIEPKFESSQYKVNLPASYNETASLTNVPMCGTVADNVVDFTYLCTVLRMDLSFLPEGYNKIVITNNAKIKKAIAGNFVVNATDQSLEPEATNQTYSITIDKGNRDLFFIPIPHYKSYTYNLSIEAYNGETLCYPIAVFNNKLKKERIYDLVQGQITHTGTSADFTEFVKQYNPFKPFEVQIDGSIVDGTGSGKTKNNKLIDGCKYPILWNLTKYMGTDLFVYSSSPALRFKAPNVAANALHKCNFKYLKGSLDLLAGTYSNVQIDYPKENDLISHNIKIYDKVSFNVLRTSSKAKVILEQTSMDNFIGEFTTFTCDNYKDQGDHVIYLSSLVLDGINSYKEIMNNDKLQPEASIRIKGSTKTFSIRLGSYDASTVEGVMNVVILQDSEGNKVTVNRDNAIYTPKVGQEQIIAREKYVAPASNPAA